MSGLSVVILSKNSSNLTKCLAAVCQHEVDANIVVVSDGLRGFDLRSYCSLQVVPGVQPFCFARNANIGIRQCGSDDVVLLNDDALLDTACGFSFMALAAKRHPEYGVLSAATNVANNPAQRQQGRSGVRDAGNAVAFVCVLLPHSTIQSIGFLDERFFGEIDGEKIYGGEDTDYCYRVKKAGLKVGVFDGCFVDHSKLPSTFRPDGRGLPINATRKRFKEIHGVEMLTQ